MDEKIVLIPSRDYLCDLGKEVEDGKTYLCESGSSFVIELKLTGEQIKKGYHSGQCDMDIQELVAVPEIRSQLEEIDSKTLEDWWGEHFLDDTPEEHASVSREGKFGCLVFDCCANAIDGYCYEMK